VRFGLPRGRERAGELFIIERGRLLQAGKVAGERNLQRGVVGPPQRLVGVNPGPQLVRLHDRKAFEQRAQRVTESAPEQAAAHTSPPRRQLRVPVPDGHGAESHVRLRGRGDVGQGTSFGPSWCTFRPHHDGYRLVAGRRSDASSIRSSSPTRRPPGGALG
jgi:hypothetical protein